LCEKVFLFFIEQIVIIAHFLVVSLGGRIVLHALKWRNLQKINCQGRRMKGFVNVASDVPRKKVLQLAMCAALPDGKSLRQISEILVDLKNISVRLPISGGFLADLTKSARAYFCGRSGGILAVLESQQKAAFSFIFWLFLAIFFIRYAKYSQRRKIFGALLRYGQIRTKKTQKTTPRGKK
jgi:hypothetical protein